jgi:hypothetical protein
MQKGSTILLRAVVLALGLAVLGLCILVLPAIHREWPNEFPDLAYLTYPILGGLVLSALSFYAALVQTLKLLTYIDKDEAFSSKSVRALRKIKRCGLAISVIYTLCLPAFYQIADKDDAPGLMVIGLIFVGAPLVVAVFAAVLERLLRSAMAIKRENDLTV